MNQVIPYSPKPRGALAKEGIVPAMTTPGKNSKADGDDDRSAHERSAPSGSVTDRRGSNSHSHSYNHSHSGYGAAGGSAGAGVAGSASTGAGAYAPSALATAGRVMAGNPRPCAPRPNSAGRTRQMNTAAAGEDGGIDDDRLGFGWVRRSGTGRFKIGATSMQMEGTSNNPYTVLHEHENSWKCSMSNTWGIQVEAKCMGVLSIVLNYEVGRDSFICVSMNNLKQLWTIEKIVTGKSVLLGTVKDTEISANKALRICVHIANGNKMSLTVDDHCFFDNLNIPKILQVRGPIGLSLTKSKAVVKNWRVFVGSVPGQHGANNINNMNVGGGSAFMNSTVSRGTAALAAGLTPMQKLMALDARLSKDEVKSMVLSDKENDASRYDSRQSRNFRDDSAKGSTSVGNGGAFSESSLIPRPPAYNGDDKRLVEIIENDMIERKLNVGFDDIAALEDAKRLVNEAVVIPLLLPEFFTGIRQPWRGVLLHGPPGTGKTMLARAVADKAKTTFFNISSSTVVSKWHGESEKLVRVLFNMARHYAPSIIFFDEVDALTSARGGSGEHEASRRLKSEIFSQLDGVTSGAEDPNHGRIMVLATTNRPWDLDDAFRRRLEKRIYIPLPDAKARKLIFTLCLKDIQLDPEVDIGTIADMCENYSGADVHLLCRDWAMAPFRRLVEGKSVEEISALRNSAKLSYSLNMEDFQASLKRIRPSVNVKDIINFEKWQSEFGST